MIAASLLVAAALAAGTPDAAPEPARVVIGPEAPATPMRSRRTPTTLTSPPVEVWRRPLPAPPINAATHAERGRPVIHGEDVFLGAAGGKALYRMGLRDGRSKGAFAAEGAVQSAPVVTDDRVWFADTAGTVWCYGIDGALIWSYRLGSPIVADPTLSGGHLFVASVADTVIALDAATGELTWRYQQKPDPTRAGELALYASPSPTVIGDVVLVGFSTGEVVALDRARGEAQWARRVGEGRYPDVVAPVIAVGSDLVAAGYYGPTVAIDTRTQNVRWRVEAGIGARPIVIDRDGAVVLLPDTTGGLRAIVALTGAELWRWDSATGGPLGEPVSTPLGVIVGATEGSVYAVDPATGTLAWSWRGDEVLDGVSAAPAVSGRAVVFVTNAGIVHGLVAPTPASAPDDGWLDAFRRDVGQKPPKKQAPKADPAKVR